MRKFARSIGSEGKSQGQQEGQCSFTCGGVVCVVKGLAPFARCMPSYWTGKATFPKGVKPLLLGTGRLYGRSKDCQLRTAYGGESNCI